MKSEPSIIPLDINQDIYALLDERGSTIGTGTKEVCAVLLLLIGKPEIVQPVRSSAPRRMNVRSAISI